MLCLESMSECAAGNSPSSQQKGSNPPFHGSVHNAQIPRLIPQTRRSASVPKRSDPSGNSSAVSGEIHSIRTAAAVGADSIKRRLTEFTLSKVLSWGSRAGKKI